MQEGELEWFHTCELKVKEYQPSQSKRKASTESKRSLKLFGDRGWELIAEEEDGEWKKGAIRGFASSNANNNACLSGTCPNEKNDTSNNYFAKLV